MTSEDELKFIAIIMLIATVVALSCTAGRDTRRISALEDRIDFLNASVVGLSEQVIKGVRDVEEDVSTPSKVVRLPIYNASGECDEWANETIATEDLKEVRDG